MKKISFHESKTLKLTNIIVKKNIFAENKVFSVDIISVDNYIKPKRIVLIGHLVQKTIIVHSMFVEKVIAKNKG